MSARDKLLKRRPRPVDVDGDQVFVRALTVQEFLDAEQLAKDEAKQFEFCAQVVAAGCVEENGQPVFSGPADKSIAMIPLDTLRLLTEKIRDASKTGNPQATLKNSEATLSAASP